MKNVTINSGWDEIIIGESYYKKLSVQMHNDDNDYTVKQARELYEAIGEYLNEYENCQVMQKSDNEFLEYESIFQGTLDECLGYSVIYVEGWDVIITINKEAVYRFAEDGWEKV